jgi:T3SS negative regulator,GrlR
MLYQYWGRSKAPQLTIIGPLRHMQVTNGLYTIRIEMKDGKRGRATGVIMLLDGQIRGGDTYFYYTGSYSFKNGKWRGDLITHQHTEAVGKNLAFGGREVSCGFTGVYSDEEAGVEGTALVGKTSVSFSAVLKLQAPL